MNREEFDKFIRKFDYNSYPEQSSFIRKLKEHEKSRDNISYVKSLFILGLFAGLSYLTYVNDSNKKESESLRLDNAETIDVLKGDISRLVKENTLLKIKSSKKVVCDKASKGVSSKKKRTNSCLKIDKCFYISHHKNILNCEGYLNGVDFGCKFVLESKYRRKINGHSSYIADEKIVIKGDRVTNTAFGRYESFKIHSISETKR